MSNTVRFATVLAVLLAMPFVSLATDNGPEEMNLKERFSVDGKKKAVIFAHRKHQAKLECIKCHLSPEGGGKLQVEIVKKEKMSNDFHKKFCWPCHMEMNVPKGKSCKTCH